MMLIEWSEACRSGRCDNCDGSRSRNDNVCVIQTSPAPLKSTVLCETCLEDLYRQIKTKLGRLMAKKIGLMQ